MPRTKEQFGDMRSNSKTIIADTALKLFTIEGYHTTSISKIAQEAGVAIGLMYNYYKSKEDLLVSIIDEHLQKMFESITRKLNQVPENQKIPKMIDLMIEVIMKESSSWKLIISVMFQPDVSKIANERIHNVFNHQEQLFEIYYQDKGVNNPAESAKVLAAILHGAILQFACS